MVDMIMVGKLGPAAIASIGLTNQPFMLLLAIFAAVNVGTTTLIAWNIGANEVKKARAVVRQTIIINLVLGLVTSVLGVVSAPMIVRFMGAKADTIVNATKYFQIVAAGLIFQGMTMGITAALRGAGDTMYPLYASFFGIWIFRVAVAYIFVHIFNWGLIGAWVALVLDQYTRSLIVYMRYRSGKWKYARIKDKKESYNN